MENVLRTIFDRAPTGVPRVIYLAQGLPPDLQGSNDGGVCIDAAGARPADQVCGLPPNAPGAGLMTPGVSLYAPLEAPEGASPVDQALSQAARAQQANDRAQFAYWSQRALAEARNVPNGDVLAVPMVEADLMAIDGNFLGASQRYRALEASLGVAARQDPSLQSVIDTVKERHKGVLAAGAATAVTSYAQARANVDAAGMNAAQRLATSCADEIYRLEPTEQNLQMTLATYAQVGLDIRELRRQVALNEAQITNIQTSQVAPGLAQGNPLQSPPSPGSDPFGLNQPPDPTMTVDQLRQFNQWANGVIARTEAHVYRMVGTANADSPYQTAIQHSTALALMGNGHDALAELRQARALFTSGRVPRTPENLVTEITVLHRLVGLSGIEYDYHQEVLTEARGLITTLNATDPNQGALFTVENMELTGTLRANRMAQHLSDPGMSDDDKDAAARDYQNAVREGQMEIVRYCETALGRITDGPTREALGDRMFDARAAVLEQDLGAALVRYQKDEKNEARADAQTALSEFQAFVDGHPNVTSARGYREAMGRATLAQAHFDFRTGRIEEAITSLHAVKENFFNSSAARIVSGRGGWPHQFGIVDDRGEFRDTNQADVMAAIRTGASKLNQEQGRGLAMCGVGAGVFIAADLAFGEKVSGAAVLAGCAAGYAMDRAVLVAQAYNEIGASYRSGVSNVTTEEAVYSAGMFALNLASMYVGGAAGGLAERGVLALGSRAGTELTSFLISRGFTPGPWTRAIGAFALREAAYVGNSAAFQAVSSRANHAGATAWSSLFGREGPRAQRETGRDYLVSWLFVRAVPLAIEANWAGRVIPGEGRWDRVARTGINTGIGLGGVQLARALATRDRRQISLDTMGGMAIDFLAMHGGNRAMEAVLPMEGVRDLSSRLDATTLRNMRKIRDDIENAPPSDSGWGGGFGGMQPAFALASGPRGGGAAALGGPNGLPAFELPKPGQGFGPFVMMASADDATNPGHRGAMGGRPAPVDVEAGDVPAEGRPFPVRVREGTGFMAPPVDPVPARDSATGGRRRSSYNQGLVIQANGILEFYNDPRMVASLDHYLTDRGEMGRMAETMRGALESLRGQVTEYERLASAERTYREAHDGQRDQNLDFDLAQQGLVVMDAVRKIETMPLDRVMTAYSQRVEQMANDLTPLEGSLAVLEVGGLGTGRPDVLFNADYAGPDRVGAINIDFAQPQNSFARTPAVEMVRYGVSVADAAAGQRVLDKLTSDGLLSSGQTFDGSDRVVSVDVPFYRVLNGTRVMVGHHHVAVRIHVDPSLSTASAAPLSRVDAAAHGYELAWNRNGLWHEPVPGNSRFPILTGDQVSVLEARGDLPAAQGTFADTGTAVTAAITDAPARERFDGMLRTLQGIYDRCPAGDPRRAIIDTALQNVRTELGESASGGASIPHLWMTMSQAFVDVAARDGALPERDRVLPRVLRIQNEMPIQKYIPTSEYDVAYANARWQYRWSPADAARAAR